MGVGREVSPMTDSTAPYPLVVEMNNTPWPTVHLPESLVPAVTYHLDQEHIWYRLDDHIISIGKSPAMTIIWFKRDADPAPIQATLNRLAQSGRDA